MTEAEMMELSEYASCIAEPLRDRPRLELAAALDTTWPDRAADIRFRVSFFRERHFGPSINAPWIKRSEQLRKRLKGLDVPPFPAPVKDHSRQRGLVGFVELVSSSLFANGAEILRRFPILDLTVVECTRDDLRRLAACPGLAQLITLNVYAPGVGDEGLRTLLESPYIANIKILGIHNAGLTMAGYEMMVEASRTTLAGLEVAGFSGNTIDSPVERQPSYDGYSGAPVNETVGVLPMEGRVLEDNLGYQKWLHPYSRFGATYDPEMFERPLDMDETPITLERAFGRQGTS